MPDENDNFLLSDIPAVVVLQDALAAYLGGFEQAEEAARVAHRTLTVTYRRAVVDAEDAAHDEDELRRLRARVARVRADCAEQTSKPITDDLGRGIWAQARRTLNHLGPGSLDATKENL